MGMFDWVDYKADCKKCGAPLEGFQTKSTTCTLDTVKPSQAGYFYAGCDKCKAWNTFTVIVKDFYIDHEVKE